MTLVAAAVAVAAIATLMLLYPSGLSAVGEVLGGFVAGLSARPAGQPFAHLLLALLVYEPLAWVFGVFGVVGALLAGNAMGRFLAGWAIVAVVVGLVYPGATSAHTLMLILPLAALGAQVVAARLAPDARAQGDAPPEPGNWEGLWEAPAWGMAAYIAGVVGLLAVVYVHLIHVGRELSSSTAPPELATVLPYLLFAALSFALIVIGFFLVGATWGSGAAVRGLVLAAALVMGAYTVSAAWGLAVSRADDARELWYLERPSRVIHMLRATVQDGSERDRGAPNTAEVVAVIPPDGALAWALRDFTNLRFADAATPDIATPLVVLPAEIEEPSLGADYLGQSFVTRWTWRFDTLGTQGLLGWLLQRRTYVPAFASERYIVWLRTDIYGVPEATP
ncbi:MAG: hypothetical protein M5R40_01730 [Anaerolineae bacterium]|nr:hypothetical protein [Anaerolineae bacterium]